jgi:serine phosphatase RsbU (regulator of sigma subunit)
MRLALISFLICFFSVTYGQLIAPHITTYTPKDYGALKAPEVWSIAQDDRGLMYFGMANEIAIFDGVNWSFIEVPKAMNITSLLWINSRMYYGGYGQFGELVYDKKGKLSANILSTSINFAFDNIWKIHAVEQTIYFQSYSTLFVLNADKLTVIKGQNPFQLSFQVGNEIYVREKKVGVKKVVGNDLKLINGGAVFSEYGLMGIVPFGTNEKAFISFEIGMWKNDINDQQSISTICPDSCANYFNKGIIGAARLKNGTYAFNSINSGLYFADKNFKLIGHLNSRNGLPSDEIKAQFEDRNGKLWLATGYGIAKIETRQPIHFLNEQIGIIGNVQSIERFKGKYYVSTSVGLFVEIDSNTYRFQYSEIKGQTWQLYNHNEEQLFVANDKGLFLTNDGQTFVKRYTGNFQSVYYDEENMFLLAGDKSRIFCLDAFSDWQAFQIFEHTGQQITNITGDEVNKCVWIGTFYGGVYRAKFDGFEYVFDQYGGTENEEQGLRYKELIAPFKIGKSVLFGTNYNILRFVNEEEAIQQLKDIGEWNDTLIKYPKFYGGSFTESEQLNIGSSNNYQFLLDAGDIVVASIDNKIGYFEGNTFHSRLFNSIEIGRINTMHLDTDYLFVGGAEGIAIVDMGRVLSEEHQIFKNEIITNIRSIKYNDSLFFGNHLFTDEELIIPYYRNAISFTVASTGNENRTQALYSWRLVGDDDNWSEWTNTKTFDFRNLHEGAYTFEVKSINVFGEESAVEQFTFTISAPWYRTILAYIGYILVFGLIVYVAIYFGRKRLKAQNLWLEGVVEERTAEIRVKNVALEHSYHEISEQKQEITDSINYAQRIQQAILPVQETISKHIDDYFVLFMPKDIVSGDFYWFAHSHEHTIFVCADCTGHGVPGAFMSMIGSDKLNQAVLEKGHVNPADIISFLNVGIKTSLKQDETLENSSRDGMDITIISIDDKKEKLKVAAANNSLLRIRNNVIEDFKATKKAVGGFTPLNQVYELTELEIQPGDCYYMTTDGYPDQFGGEKGKKLKIAVLKELLLKIHQKPMEEQREILRKHIIDWMGDIDQIDDICVIGVRL